MNNLSEDVAGREPRRVSALNLDDHIVATLRARLPRVAELTVAAITVEVPSYAGTFSGRRGQNIENAVQMALGSFLHIAAESSRADSSSPPPPAFDGAYELGRGEARSGRSVDALLSAYRVGARVSWRELSATAVAAGLDAATIARFAELVFAFIDELSAASASGHADEQATAGRVRQRHLERLGQSLLAGEPAEILLANADRAAWSPPATLTAVLLPQAQTPGLTAQLDPSTLKLSEDLPGIGATESATVLLVPDMHGPRRPRLLRALTGRPVVVGPARDWMQAQSSYRRVLRARGLASTDAVGVVDTEDHLTDLVLTADSEAIADLRRRVLAPLAGLRLNTAERLEETLRSWLLNRGQRDAVAAELFVHAQTVRYRMTQLRELYGDRLDDPRTLLELTIALAVPSPPPAR